jgi:C1A family cysteine protease
MTAVQRRKSLTSLVALALLLALLPLLASPLAPSQAGPAEVFLDESDAGQRITLHAGQVLVLNLEANPSTGYLWRVEAGAEGIVRQVGGYEFEPESHLLGAPGIQRLRLAPVGAGQATLRLAYRRAWEEMALKTFVVEVETAGRFEGSLDLDSPSQPEAASRSAGVEMGSPATNALLPTSFNWCDQGGCTPVKNQGACGSCWAFGTVGPLESLILLNDGVTRDLAEQYLVSCNTQGWGCGGGWWAHDYHLDVVPPGEPEAGAVYEADFPYQAADVACNPPHTHHEKITDWAYVGNSSGVPPVADIKQAIYDHGPVAAAICVGPAFDAYSGGVFSTHETCSGTVNHGIVLVGWDDSLGVWHLRNSWSAGWGESGYMRITYGTSLVGYGASYVDYVSVPQTPLAPNSLSASSVSQSQINLTWDDNSSNETGFKIERSPNGATNWGQIGTVGADVTAYTNSGLPGETQFYYRVRAYNTYGDSEYSNVASAVTWGNFDEVAYLPLMVRNYGSGESSSLPIDEGFEGGLVPPAGWTRIQTNGRDTWNLLSGSAYSGAFAAQCQYDDMLGYQNEVLLSPQFQADSARLQFYSFGSLQWCRDLLDNCDLNVWLVVGDWGGGDDIFVRTVDGDWIDTFTWSPTNINLTPYLPSGTPVRVAWQYEGMDGAQIAIDGIQIQE